MFEASSGNEGEVVAVLPTASTSSDSSQSITGENTPDSMHAISQQDELSTEDLEPLISQEVLPPAIPAPQLPVSELGHCYHGSVKCALTHFSDSAYSRYHLNAEKVSFYNTLISNSD